MVTFREEVQTILKDLEDLLVSKNEKYGNSALEPKRIFSRANATEQIKVRIDDKLSRMSAGTNDNEDTVQDLMGYLVLLKLAENQSTLEIQPDTAVGEASIGISNEQMSESWKIEDALRGQRKWTFEGYGTNPLDENFNRILVHNNREPHYAFKNYEMFEKWVTKYPWSKDESRK